MPSRATVVTRGLVLRVTFRSSPARAVGAVFSTLTTTTEEAAWLRTLPSPTTRVATYSPTLSAVKMGRGEVASESLAELALPTGTCSVQR